MHLIYMVILIVYTKQVYVDNSIMNLEEQEESGSQDANASN